MARAARIQVTGAKELRRALKAMEHDTGDLKDIHKAAAEIVIERARDLVPYVSGALAGTHRAARRATGAAVLAGRSSVPYAGPIHFGWAARNISPQPWLYDALDDRRDEVAARYEREIDGLVRKLDRETP
jgi:hypothetical protein